MAARELGLEVEERSIARTELYRSDELFFTGTAAQIAPVTRIDGRPIGQGTPGETTLQIQKLYADVVRNRHERYRQWCTLVPVGGKVANK